MPHDADFDVNRPGTLGYITAKAKAAGYKLPGEPGAMIEGVTLDSKNYYHRRHGDGFELVRYDNDKGPKVTKSEGALANLDFLANAYDKSELHDLMTIEVYMADGSVKTASNRAEALQVRDALRGQ